ncbi:hydrolase [Brevibacterium sp. Mu109]|uniref:hydrolase n=1 Tax=Brevibacterium sp. Mu109 TaxID=1255669 RepID=UPI0021522193|nr:hydrolase [Brevibacterium sp. Mu109]
MHALFDEEGVGMPEDEGAPAPSAVSAGGAVPGHDGARSVARVTLCATCGVEAADPPPAVCPICEDERQFVPAVGQVWTTVGELADSGRSIEVAEVEPGLHSLRTQPRTGIGQTCYLAAASGADRTGGLLFDVPPFIDDAAVQAVAARGGVGAIVASHPHMYGLQLEWSRAFDDAPILVSRKDSGWVQCHGPAIELYDEEAEPLPGIRVRQVGGHFPGSSVALWRAPSDGALVMLGSDSVSPVARAGWVTFMRSFPNYLPLSARAVRMIAERVADLDVERIYGSFGQRLMHGGARAIAESADRYAAWVSGAYDDRI